MIITLNAAKLVAVIATNRNAVIRSNVLSVEDSIATSSMAALIADIIIDNVWKFSTFLALIETKYV